MALNINKIIFLVFFLSMLEISSVYALNTAEIAVYSNVALLSNTDSCGGSVPCHAYISFNNPLNKNIPLNNIVPTLTRTNDNQQSTAHINVELSHYENYQYALPTSFCVNGSVNTNLNCTALVNATRIVSSSDGTLYPGENVIHVYSFDKPQSEVSDWNLNFAIPSSAFGSAVAFDTRMKGWAIWGSYSGATITYVPFNSTVNWTVYTYLTNGTFNVTSCDNCSIQVLVVAGGGGGGFSYAGGGGAGGLIYNASYAVTPGKNYTVTVGLGGARTGSADCTPGNNGQNSVFDAIVAQGGAGGQCRTNITQTRGGSGGGAGYTLSGYGLGNTSPAQGNNGGTGSNGGSPYCGGGGGGAGAAGGTASGNNCGGGGIGVQYNLSGTPTYYAGGGSASCDTTDYATSCVAPGAGGGGNGGNKNGYPTDGTANTGGGGGGSWATTGGYGGAGGSGIVIIRYLNITALPGTVNETDGRQAILQGIQSSVINASYSAVYDRQVYIRIANGSQYYGRFDLFVTSGNKRWAFNYDQNTTSGFPVFANITPVFYVWQKANMTAVSISNDVSGLINATN